jgi:cytochrome c-type biogenesis protein CcmH
MLRPLPLLVLALAACSGSQNPPPPVATATPSRSADGVQPLSSRDAASAASPSAPGAATPGAANATLPPGHPPIGSADPHGNAASSGPAKSAGSIAGTVALSPKLSAGPKDVLYVMAKKGASTLAVRRIESPTFPVSFEISGADSMTAGISFEGPVDVVARVSRSGDAIPAKGDLEGTAKDVKIPANGVKLTIDSVRQ